MTGYSFYSIMKMPETIPIHLTDGEIDGWGISYRSTSEREDNIKKPLLTNKAAFFKRVLFCMRHWCVTFSPQKVYDSPLFRSDASSTQFQRVRLLRPRHLTGVPPHFPFPMSHKLYHQSEKQFRRNNGFVF